MVAAATPTFTPLPTATSTPSVTATPTAPAEPGEVIYMVPEVVGTRPHDANAFTQGLILYNGFLYESTGLYGQSSLRQVNPQTGEVIQFVPLAETYFAEGLERVEDRLIQITWREQTAFVYDINTFALLNTFSYAGEGWGLCYDGLDLYMSNGSDSLTVRDPETFAVRSEIPVTLDGQPVVRLNELECVGNTVFANIWQTDTIVQIDKNSGQVVAVIDATGLLTTEERTTTDVLNGIVYQPETNTFLITGKLWPKIFEVHFVVAG
ncbi:MAG: glutaminyl-peptide cyclotransferase [Chloroflexi bacterium]|nr:glutaminyl-peptide cyclotransferase [Chloroflexota bacterium]